MRWKLALRRVLAPRRPGDLLREREELILAYPIGSLWFNNTRGTAYQLLDLTFAVEDELSVQVTYASYSIVLSAPGEIHLSAPLQKFLTRYTRRS